MAKIVDPDQLNQGTEVTFTPGSKTIQLLVAGNLDDSSPGKSSGVTHQALYSFAKEEWLADGTLQPVRFPLDPIFEAKFLWTNGWQPADQQTKDLIRDGGFRVELVDDEYACIISLGSMDDPAVDLAYFQQVSGFSESTTAFDKTGELNENILIFDGTQDFRDFLKVFLREQGKTYAEGNLLVDQDLSALTYQAYRLPLSNDEDLNIATSDGDIDSLAPYTGMSIAYLKGSGFTTFADSTTYPAEAVVQDSTGRWFFTPGGGTSNTAGATDTASDTGITDWESYAGERQIGSNWYAFNRIIDGNAGTKTEIYEWAQRQLRKSSDINADDIGSLNQNGFGIVNGDIATLLTEFVGDQLKTFGGLFIDNFDSNDTNSITMRDITVDGGGLDSEGVPATTTERNFPFVSAFTIQFNDIMVDEPDVDTIYKMFFQRTTRDSGTDIEMASAAGDTGTLQTTSTDLSVNFANGDYLRIDGFSTEGNNGLFRVVSAVSATSMDVQRVDGQTTVANEAAGPTVNLDANPYDTPDAIVVNDNGGSPITGQISGSSVSHDFDYDGNTQGGRTAGTDAPVAIIAIGKSGFQWIDGTFTITRATGLNFPLNAAVDRVYANPA